MLSALSLVCNMYGKCTRAWNVFHIGIKYCVLLTFQKVRVAYVLFWATRAKLLRFRKLIYLKWYYNIQGLRLVLCGSSYQQRGCAHSRWVIQVSATHIWCVTFFRSWKSDVIIKRCEIKFSAVYFIPLVNETKNEWIFFDLAASLMTLTSGISFFLLR